MGAEDTKDTASTRSGTEINFWYLDGIKNEGRRDGWGVTVDYEYAWKYGKTPSRFISKIVHYPCGVFTHLKQGREVCLGCSLPTPEDVIAIADILKA